MLILERPIGSKIFVSDLVEVEILGVRSGNRVKVGVKAPRSLPVSRDRAHRAPAQAEAPDAAAPDQLGPRVLIIEDDRDFAELLRMAFRAAGVQRLEFCTSLAAVRTLLADRDKPDSSEGHRSPDAPFSLVLCDQMLGDGWGNEAVGELRRARGFERVPVVMLSSLAEPDIVDAALDAGANAYMEKAGCPYELRHFAQQLVGFWCHTARVA